MCVNGVRIDFDFYLTFTNRKALNAYCNLINPKSFINRWTINRNGLAGLRRYTNDDDGAMEPITDAFIAFYSNSPVLN